METILPAGELVLLKPTANLSTGGTSTDVTDEVHPVNIFLAERIAKIIGLDICGIDIMATDLRSPLFENGGAVLEVNAALGLPACILSLLWDCRAMWPSPLWICFIPKEQTEGFPSSP